MSRVSFCDSQCISLTTANTVVTVNWKLEWMLLQCLLYRYYIFIATVWKMSVQRSVLSIYGQNSAKTCTCVVETIHCTIDDSCNLILVQFFKLMTTCISQSHLFGFVSTPPPRLLL